MRRYGASKLCFIMIMYVCSRTFRLHVTVVPLSPLIRPLTPTNGELQGHLSAGPALSTVSILSVDPGSVPTNTARSSPFFIQVLMFQLLFPLNEEKKLMVWRDIVRYTGLKEEETMLESWD